MVFCGNRVIVYTLVLATAKASSSSRHYCVGRSRYGDRAPFFFM